MAELIETQAEDDESQILIDDANCNYEPTQQEILEYAQYLEFDVKNDGDLLYIAREGLLAELPEQWKACKTKTNDIYYFNFQTGESSWDHPLDQHYKNKYLLMREQKKAQTIAKPISQKCSNSLQYQEIDDTTPSKVGQQVELNAASLTSLSQNAFKQQQQQLCSNDTPQNNMPMQSAKKPLKSDFFPSAQTSSNKQEQEVVSSFKQESFRQEFDNKQLQQQQELINYDSIKQSQLQETINQLETSHKKKILMIDQQFEQQIDKLQEQIKQLDTQNNIWLQNYIDENTKLHKQNLQELEEEVNIKKSSIAELEERLLLQKKEQLQEEMNKTTSNSLSNRIAELQQLKQKLQQKQQNEKQLQEQRIAKKQNFENVYQEKAKKLKLNLEKVQSELIQQQYARVTQVREQHKQQMDQERQIRFNERKKKSFEIIQKRKKEINDEYELKFQREKQALLQQQQAEMTTFNSQVRKNIQEELKRTQLQFQFDQQNKWRDLQQQQQFIAKQKQVKISQINEDLRVHYEQEKKALESQLGKKCEILKQENLDLEHLCQKKSQYAQRIGDLQKELQKLEAQKQELQVKMFVSSKEQENVLKDINNLKKKISANSTQDNTKFVSQTDIRNYQLLKVQLKSYESELQIKKKEVDSLKAKAKSKPNNLTSLTPNASAQQSLQQFYSGSRTNYTSTHNTSTNNVNLSHLSKEIDEIKTCLMKKLGDSRPQSFKKEQFFRSKPPIKRSGNKEMNSCTDKSWQQQYMYQQQEETDQEEGAASREEDKGYGTNASGFQQRKTFQLQQEMMKRQNSFSYNSQASHFTGEPRSTMHYKNKSASGNFCKPSTENKDWQRIIELEQENLQLIADNLQKDKLLLVSRRDKLKKESASLQQQCKKLEQTDNSMSRSLYKSLREARRILEDDLKLLKGEQKNFKEKELAVKIKQKILDELARYYSSSSQQDLMKKEVQEQLDTLYQSYMQQNITTFKQQAFSGQTIQSGIQPRQLQFNSNQFLQSDLDEDENDEDDDKSPLTATEEESAIAETEKESLNLWKKRQQLRILGKKLNNDENINTINNNYNKQQFAGHSLEDNRLDKGLSPINTSLEYDYHFQQRQTLTNYNTIQRQLNKGLDERLRANKVIQDQSAFLSNLRSQMATQLYMKPYDKLINKYKKK